jgi:hypothetical protein
MRNFPRSVSAIRNALVEPGFSCHQMLVFIVRNKTITNFGTKRASLWSGRCGCIAPVHSSGQFKRDVLFCSNFLGLTEAESA